MAVAQLLLSMEPKYICHNHCTMDTSSPIVPKLSTEILLIPAILELYHKPPLKLNPMTYSIGALAAPAGALRVLQQTQMPELYKANCSADHPRKLGTQECAKLLLIQRRGMQHFSSNLS